MVRFFFFRLQPIELFKTFFYFVTVKILTFEKFKNSQIKYFLSFLLLSSVIILLIDQPDLGQSILLISKLDCNSFYFWSKFILHFWFFFIFLISISSLLFLMPEKFGYIINRLISFIDPVKEINFNHLQL